MAEQRVSRNEFVRSWETHARNGGSVKDVAVELGLKVTSCQTKASKCRADGIPLSHFTRGGRPAESIESALELLAELRGVDVATVRSDAETKESDSD